MTRIVNQIDSLLEGVQSGFFYHGTGLKNAKSILKSGLKPSGGKGWGLTGLQKDPAVFVSGSFGKAATYALGSHVFKVPVVFGVRITKPGRLAKLQTDPADHDSSKWDSDFGSDDIDENPFSYFIDRLDLFAKKRGWGRSVFSGLNGIIPDVSGLWSNERRLRKVNLYKGVKSWLAVKYDASKAKNEYRNFLRSFRAGNYDGVHIRNNGALRFDSSFWEDKHQLVYPEALPVSTIKEIWVPVEHLKSTPTQTTVATTEPLPGIQREIIDKAVEVADYIRDLSHEEAGRAMKDEVRDLARRHDKYVVDAFVDLLVPIAEAIEDGEDLDLASSVVVDEAYYLLGDSDFLSRRVRFGLVDAKDLLRL